MIDGGGVFVLVLCSFCALSLILRAIKASSSCLDQTAAISFPSCSLRRYVLEDEDKIGVSSILL